MTFILYPGIVHQPENELRLMLGGMWKFNEIQSIMVGTVKNLVKSFVYPFITGDTCIIWIHWTHLNNSDFHGLSAYARIVCLLFFWHFPYSNEVIPGCYKENAKKVGKSSFRSFGGWKKNWDRNGATSDSLHKMNFWGDFEREICC